MSRFVYNETAQLRSKLSIALKAIGKLKSENNELANAVAAATIELGYVPRALMYLRRRRRDRIVARSVVQDAIKAGIGLNQMIEARKSTAATIKPHRKARARAPSHKRGCNPSRSHNCGSKQKPSHNCGSERGGV